jgi:hypothetical protein
LTREKTLSLKGWGTCSLLDQSLSKFAIEIVSASFSLVAALIRFFTLSLGKASNPLDLKYSLGDDEEVGVGISVSSRGEAGWE